MTTSGDSFRLPLKSWLWSVAFGAGDGSNTLLARLRGGARSQENSQWDHAARVHRLLFAFFVTAASAGVGFGTPQAELTADTIAGVSFVSL
jgi:hypothetical protein